MIRKAFNPKTLYSAGPYSHAVATDGHLFLSGKTGTEGNSSSLVSGGIEPETRQVFANLKTVLADAGLDFGDVVKCNVYLTDMGDFAAMNKVYASNFGEPYPARTTVAVAALPGGARVEIEMVASLR